MHIIEESYLQTFSHSLKYYIAGHVFRIISCLNQVLFACNNAYCINEKKAIKLLETFEYKPEKYAERVNHIFEVLSLSLFECYDMTEEHHAEHGGCRALADA